MGFLVSSPLSGQEAISGSRIFTTQVGWETTMFYHIIHMYMYISFLYGFRVSSPLSGLETIGGFRIFTTQVVRKTARLFILLSTHVLLHIISLRFPRFVTAKWSGNRQWFLHLYHPGGRETTTLLSYYPHMYNTHQSSRVSTFCHR